MATLIWYGNACVEFRTAETRLIFDPFTSVERTSEDPRLHGADAFLITHGHFDHVSHVPELSTETRTRVYLPPEVAARLRKDPRQNPALLYPLMLGEATTLKGCRFLPFPAEHVRFDPPLIWRTMRRASENPRAMGTLLNLHRQYPLGAVVAWYIEAEGVRLLHLGSLGLRENQYYPSGVDVLSLPLQGHSRIHELAFQLIKRLEPKRVLLHHFNDAFPPMSQAVSPEPLLARMREERPAIEVWVPSVGAEIPIPNP